MRAWTVLGFGWRRLRRHPAIVLAPFGLAAAPALALAWLSTSPFAAALDSSLYAQKSVEQGSLSAWIELFSSAVSAPVPAPFPWLSSLLLSTAVVVLGQVLVAGGLVETLLERQVGSRATFAAGMARNAPRFAISLLWVVVVAGLVLLGLGLGFMVVGGLLEDLVPLPLTVAPALAALAVFLVPLHLAFDLSRIAVASHGGRRCLSGLLAAWWHLIRHPMGLVPVYVVCVLVVLVAGAAGWGIHWQHLPTSTAGLGLFLLIHHLSLLVGAACRCLLWSSAVGYYQAIGEPAWAGRALRGPAG